MRWKRTGTIEDRAVNGKPCSVEGCGRQATARSWCTTHWARVKKHGDPQAHIPIQVLTPVRGQVCKVEGCPEPAQSLLLCKLHYARVRRLGEPGEATRRIAPKGQRRSVDANGYVRISGTSATRKGRDVLEHRSVMEQLIGRPLRPEESVHHRNGVRDDNRPENLELWSKSHPAGQRVEDKVTWAREILALYGDLDLTS